MNTAFDPWSSARSFFSETVVQAVLGLIALSCLIAVAYFVLSKLRDSNTDDQRLDEELQKNFEEMRSEGDIDDQEFRKIKALLSGGKSITAKASSPSTPSSSSLQPIDPDRSKPL